MASASKTLQIGIMMDTVQLIDLIGADILARMRFETIQAAAIFSPQVKKLLPHAPALKLHFLSTTLKPTVMTTGLTYSPNMTYDQCPRDLDIVIVGGSSKNHRPAAADKFMKEAWKKTPVWLTVSTGSMWLASSGVLNGIEATTNRPFHASAKETHDKVKWVDKRWVSSPKPYEGKSSLKPAVWTAGGGGCGIDMVVSFCHANFNPELVNFAIIENMGYEPGPQDY
ncbi:unnamed protein product [Clonostachys solani]|uniref:DJ-1/PfpI domain-containing protein n=1 Tax=Clonostachys solani TaxID=160281 RepID=A0A9P0EEF9_9HYPO|nr:unnamed protein product [Clonostachys solani]